MPRDPVPPPPERVIPLPKPANDNRPARRLRAKVLIAKDLPITQTEIEVIAFLLDDLAGIAANDNGEQPE